jgi:hypothetical protein
MDPDQLYIPGTRIDSYAQCNYEGARIYYRTKLGGQCTNVGAIKNTSSFVVSASFTL